MSMGFTITYMWRRGKGGGELFVACVSNKQHQEETAGHGQRVQLRTGLGFRVNILGRTGSILVDGLAARPAVMISHPRSTPPCDSARFPTFLTLSDFFDNYWGALTSA